MSERRRASTRNQQSAPIPADQKVWGPQDSGAYGGGARDGGSASHGRSGAGSGGRGRRRHRDEFSYESSHDGAYGGSYGGDSYGDAQTSYGDAQTSYGDSYGGGDSHGGREDYAAPRGRRRGGHPTGEDVRAYTPPPPAAPAGGDDFYEEDRPRRRRGRRGGGEESAAAFPVADGHGPPADEPEGSGRRGRRGGGGSSGDAAGGGSGGARRGPGLWGWVSIVMTSVLVIGTLTAYKTYRSTLGLIGREKSTDELDKNRPENQTGAINVLLVGSDTRTGDNKKYGQYMENDGERTDTIMLLHVSPNRDGATLLSFPRDSMVMISACKNTKTGAVIPQHLAQINSAFSDGGMRCTRRTIEDLTKIRIDHFVKVDFTGFKNIVNALGGVEICLPQAVNDKKSKLNLPAGRQVVRGEAALGYVRLRHIGDGSDIGRIKRQQVFISQVVKKATSRALLTDMGKLTAFIEATAQSVTMDDDLNTDTLIQIAQSASKLTAKGFKATTVPWEPYAPDKNRVQWKQPDAENLFSAIRNDTEVTPTASPSAAASPGAKPKEPTVTKPQQVKVQVFNGTNENGKAREVAEALAAEGFKVVGVGDARRPDNTDQPKTMIRYTGQGWDYAKVLTGKVRVRTGEETAQVAPETGKVVAGTVTPFTPAAPPADAPKGKVPGPIIQLVIGADWDGVKTPIQVGDNAVTAETNICAT
ncbi:LCP family protein [Sphaerimonospora sp. CA-214678]|uniref:LCP family protein n=1 Tax=Sphaerimonospora sp. CA-214678 TaxID=3240029 RepID=UPI003D8E0E62